MATDTRQPQATTTRSGAVPYRLTVRQFLKMIDAGVFPASARVELLGGVLVAKRTKTNPHDYATFQLAEILRPLVAPGWCVREEKSIQLGRYWRPEPDIAVVRGPRERYRATAPRRADLGMLVEVADASYAIDRGVKWRRYAAAGVPVYAIVNLNTRQVEVYTNPTGRGPTAAYRDCTTYREHDEAPLVIDGRELGRIAVRQFLP